MEWEMCSYLERSSTWIPQLFATFKIVSNTILPAMGPIHRWSPPVPAPFLHQSSITSIHRFYTSICSLRRFAQGRACHPQPFSPYIPLLIPRYPRGFPSLCVDISCIIGFAADAARCAWTRICQGCIGRFEHIGGPCHPPWPQIRTWTYACEAC
jgi:hypothetical protein